MPLVSVVVPTFNRPAMLAEALASVLGQTMADLEVIVVDDGSDPPARAVAESFGDPRIRYVWRPNRGRSAARNAGIALAGAEYVGFLDDDDLWLPGKLLAQAPVLDVRPEVGLVTSGWRYINSAGELLREMKPWLWRPKLGVDDWLFSCPALPSGILVRRAWLERAGGFDESLDANEDRDLWLRLACLGCGMEWVEEVVCSYRLHGENSVLNAVRQKLTSIAMLDKFFAREDLPAEMRARRGEVYAWVHLQGAAGEYGAGEIAQARDDVARSVALNPGLAHGDFRGMFGTLVARAADPVMGDPLRYLETVFDNLPPEASAFGGARRGAMAWAARFWLNDCRARNDRAGEERYLAELAALEPPALVRRDALSAVATLVTGGWGAERAAAK